ncbi:MAG: BamA/TamA family outer membrane protein [Ignavibacteriales bacterium]|nr:BamA/TamA family outer membrane protein [Ignavibacteriales bacterium]
MESILLKFLFILLFVSIFLNLESFSQSKDTINTNPKIVNVTPGPEYNAGWLHKIFFGEHWRKMWTTPIKVEVLDLNSFAGGLVPLKKGGGFQTKTLHLKGNDGRYYKFRSINKDPKAVLPKELQESLVANVVQDQISSANPLSAVIAAPIISAVGVLNAQPKVVVMPEDEKLGEFKNEFANVLGMIEEKPEADDSVAFGGAEKIKNTFNFFEELEKDNDNQVAATDYLKARLMDMFLSDWDRHTGQWNWARYKLGNKKLWYPIPKDRDQAFSKFDGFLPWIAELAVPQLEGFSNNYPEIEDLTWSGRFLDRRLLSSITKAQWDSVTNFVISKLMDDVLEKSVSCLPVEYFSIAGKELIETLKIRRDKLKNASDEYYDLNSSYVDIRGSNKSEFLEVNRENDNQVEVLFFNRNKKSDDREEEPFFHRIYNCNETEELRIYLLGGDDIAVVKGKVENSILVRIIGGEGKDKLIDSSEVDGYLFSILPFICVPEKLTVFYDDGMKTEIVEGANTKVIRDKFPEPKNETEKYEPPVRDWGYDWKLGPYANYNNNVGITFGAGPILYKFGFRTSPYIFRMQFLLGFAPKIKSYFADYKADFYNLVKSSKLSIHLRKSELTITNFYGFGNESPRNVLLAKKGYYKLEYLELICQPSLEFELAQNFSLTVAYQLKYSQVVSSGDKFIMALKPYGIKAITSLGLKAELLLNKCDNSIVPTKGFWINLKSSFTPDLFKNQSKYARGILDSRFYIPVNTIFKSVFAFRFKGEKVWGNFPFYEAAFLGGSESVRGFDRQRFAGDAEVEANAELRILLTKFNFVVPGVFGITSFTESGRVFQSGDASRKWHTAFGGGVWASFINSDYTFSLSYAKAPEDWGVYAVYGFTF